MKRIVSFAVLAGTSICLLASAGNASESRVLVELPNVMREHMLRNMRDHLLAISQIQEALAAGEFERAADVAEKRMGMSSLASHGASHMAPYMPQAMRDIGTQMHRAASRFAIVAQETSADGDLPRAIGALSRITQQCVACHAAFRVQ